LIEAFALDFETYGTDAIEQVRAEKPHEYLRIAASLVPKQFEIEDGRQPFAVIPEISALPPIADIPGFGMDVC
jgi:hypothetical protein